MRLPLSGLTLVVCVSVLGGCSSKQSGSESPAAGQTETGALPEEARFRMPDLLDSTLSDSDRPTSVESFKAAFVRRFEADMYTPFIDLAYWADAREDRKKEYLKGIRATFTMPTLAHRATIRSAEEIDIRPVAEYGGVAVFPSEGDEAIRLAPPATHVMGITAHFNPTVSVTNYFAVGQKDGKFYFCTIAPQS